MKFLLWEAHEAVTVYDKSIETLRESAIQRATSATLPQQRAKLMKNTGHRPSCLKGPVY